MKKFVNLFCVLITFNLLAADIYVIGNSNVTLTSAEVKDVYKGDKQVAGSVKISPVDNKSLQNDFLTKVVGIDKIKYDAVWAKKSFQDGLSAPKVKGTDADVIEFVKSTPGGIGYVAAPADCKVIGKF